VNRSLLVTFVGVVIVAVAIALNFLPRHTEDARQPPSTEGPVAGDPTAGDPAAPAPDAPPRIPQPTFDVVRVNPEGDAVFAGRAEPGSEVAILDGGTIIGLATPDERGEWVFVPEAPLPPGSRRLSLEMRIEGEPTTPSHADVVLVVPEHGRDVAGRPAGDAAGALALSVPRGAGPTAVLQSPGGSGSAGPLGIDAVDYTGAPDTENAKEVSIGGRSEPGSSVRVYLDDALLGEAVAGTDGRWYLPPRPAPPPGDHRLRADQVDGGGKVVARVEVPLEPLALATGAGRAAAPGAIVIEPGNNLWRIAHNRYGTGSAYTVIYEANRAQIKDPDLIYPGQVFTLPARR
jgi:nucleoid-associated protein YgaU